MYNVLAPNIARSLGPMAPESATSEQEDTVSHARVFKVTARKTFKACRACRLQKARCESEKNAPCRRCQDNGRDCIFDDLHTRKRDLSLVDNVATSTKKPRLPIPLILLYAEERPLTCMLLLVGTSSSRTKFAVYGVKRMARRRMLEI